jgi:hypothetical protein
LAVVAVVVVVLIVGGVVVVVVEVIFQIKLVVLEQLQFLYLSGQVELVELVVWPLQLPQQLLVEIHI